MTDRKPDFYDFAAAFFRREADSVGPKTRFRRDLKAGRLEVLRFVFETEAVYDVFFPEAAVKRLVTVGQMAELLSLCRGESVTEHEENRDEKKV